MSNGNRNQRNRGGGGGGGNQQRRRRSGGGNQNRQQQQRPSGPAMTALGESTYEAVFDHGNEGYGIWFDGMVREDPTYKQNWKGTGLRPIYVKIEEDRIVISKELDRPRSQEQPAEDAEDNRGNEVEAFSDEEAARLFAEGGEDADEGSDGDDGDDDGEGEGDGDEGEAEPEAKKPAPRKRVTRRKPAASSDDE